MACRLRRERRRTVGVVAAGRGVDTTEVALCMAPALRDACSRSVAVLLPHEVDGRHAIDVAEAAGVKVHESRGAWLLEPRELRYELAELGGRHQVVLVAVPPPGPQGEHPGAYDLLDGIVLVARVGHVTEDQLRERHRATGSDKNLGVLLLDG